MRFFTKSGNGERGSVTVEASIALVAFLFGVGFIISLINVFTLHNRVQFALNSAAHELAAVSYPYAVFQVRRAEKQVASDGKKYVEPIDNAGAQLVDTYGKMQSVASSMGAVRNEAESGNIQNTVKAAQTLLNDGQAAVDSMEASAEKIYGLMSDPHSTLIGVIYYVASGADYLLHEAAGQMTAKGLTKKYLEMKDNSFGTSMTADEYLEANNVKEGYGGFSFKNSIIFNEQDSKVKFSTNYDIDIGFYYPLLRRRKLHMEQSACVYAWLDGDQHYLSEFIGE